FGAGGRQARAPRDAEDLPWRVARSHQHPQGSGERGSPRIPEIVMANHPDDPLPLPLRAASPRERLFPTLTATHIAQIAAHGRRRATTRGEVLVEAGDRAVP